MTHIPVFIEPAQPEVFYCGVQTREASWYVDPEPAEFCDVEVPEEGDICPLHEDDEPDYDAMRKDARFDRD